jgi:hypothetical protein
LQLIGSMVLKIAGSAAFFASLTITLLAASKYVGRTFDKRYVECAVGFIVLFIVSSLVYVVFL